MEKYNKKQRHAIYKKALKCFDEKTTEFSNGLRVDFNVYDYICWSIQYGALGSIFNVISTTEILESFPEMEMFEPVVRTNENTVSWFKGNKKGKLSREIVLEFCIIMTR